MRVARFYSPERIEIREETPPSIKEGEILLRVEACGVCGTDLFKLRAGAEGKVLGHEISGVVEEVRGVKGLKAGERVFVAHHVPCFVCSHCRRGNYSLCSLFHKTNIYPGGFAELIRVPSPNVEKALIKIEDDLSFETATLIEPLACAWRNIKRMSPHPGDEILIVGGGPAGLMHLHLLEVMGLYHVDLLEIREERKRWAKNFGARRVISPGDRSSYDIVVICAGNLEAVREGMERVRKGGKVSIFAQLPPGNSYPLDPNLIYFGTNLMGTYSSTPIEQREIYDMMKIGRLEADKFISHIFPLSRIQEAFSLALKGEDSCKIIIKPQEP